MPYYPPSVVSNTAYDSSWSGVTTIAPSQNAVYNKFEASQHPGYIAGNWYFPADVRGEIVGGVAITVNNIVYVPFWVQRLLTISNLGVRITTSELAQNLKLAIYANNAATMRPTGTPLAETGNITTASAANVNAAVTGGNVTLTPGLYWSAVWTSSNIAAVQVQVTDNPSGISSWVGATSQDNISNAPAGSAFTLQSSETYGTWPDAASETITISTANRNFIMQFKAA